MREAPDDRNIMKEDVKIPPKECELTSDGLLVERL